MCAVSIIYRHPRQSQGRNQDLAPLNNVYHRKYFPTSHQKYKFFVATNIAGKYPKFSLKMTTGVTLTNVEMLWSLVNGTCMH